MTDFTRKKDWRLYCVVVFAVSVLSVDTCMPSTQVKRVTKNFGADWKFYLGDITKGQEPGFDDSRWRVLDLPHDWSIEGEFSKDNPAGVGGGALPGGIGWYRKTFSVPESEKDRLTFIRFDGVYRNSEVWINGNRLGKRPYGYSSFEYELTPFLKYDGETNILAVRVDNSKQPNSRWYSGSGIYRHVWLVTTEKIHVDHWGTFVTTPEVNDHSARISVRVRVMNASGQDQEIVLKTVIRDDEGGDVASTISRTKALKDSVCEVSQEFVVVNPALWSVEHPFLYKAATTVESGGRTCDDYETTFGIRTFRFDPEKGFVLNGKLMKIRGVCNHHDLGCLGAAINTRALERQLEILKAMGCNAIRTSHNPPATELLDLCDRMGFIVMDEAFDMWKKGKAEFDYSWDWDKWHRRDLADMVLRDRNHPSVFIWSIGNEVLEQWDHEDSAGSVIARELTYVIRSLDTTRPITANCNDRNPSNPIIHSGALDLIGYSYGQNEYCLFPDTYPGKKLIGSETTSALATRGYYDMPSDSIRRWPVRWDLPLLTGNPDNTCSSYDNCSAPWGSTHEETWRLVKKFEFVSGMFAWTGFDYLGEPTPYDWPSRSSYFGILDLSGFPKDAYYMYQSEWTDKPVLHVFPHWNWHSGDTVDVWAYTNCDSVQMYLNGRYVGTRQKVGEVLHLMWRLPFEAGMLKGVGYARGREIIVQEIRTAGKPARITLEADRNKIAANGSDLSFVTVRILDEKGTLVPDADNLVRFEISGEGRIVGVDNGSETSHESFKSDRRKAFNGLCLVVVQSTRKTGKILLKAMSDGLEGSSIIMETK